MGPHKKSVKKGSKVTKNTSEYIIFLKKKGLSSQ